MNDITELFSQFDRDTLSREQAIFASVFILQNRMQTAGDKLQPQISMKQWLLLTMTAFCPEPKTMTNVGALMGCSRQNVKKIASVLEKKGFVELSQGGNNSVRIELTDKIDRHTEELGWRLSRALDLLFEDFSEEEIAQLFLLYAKLYAGVERMEKYAEDIDL